jgi:hypothetical protein
MFECNAANEPGFALPVLEISDADRVLMKVIPIEMNIWPKVNQDELLSQVSERLETARRDGLSAIVLWEDYWLAKKTLYNRGWRQCWVDQPKSPHASRSHAGPTMPRQLSF